MASRKRTVLSAVIPRASRAKPKTDHSNPERHQYPGRTYRCRPTDEGPFGGWDLSYYTDDAFDVEIRQADNEAEGIASVIEHAIRGGYSPGLGS